MSTQKALLVFVLVCTCFTFVMADSKPIMVIDLFRHGARGAYDKTWDTGKVWDNRLGELTNAGMRMHYLLGKVLAQDYAYLLGSYDPTQISVFSTDVNRTIMSAYSHLFGIFTPGGTPLTINQTATALPPGLENYNFSEFITDNMPLPNGIQAVPVHIVDRSRDYVLTPDNSCPNFNKISQASLNSEAYKEFQNITSLTKKIIEQYANQSNITLTDIWSYGSLSDIMIANYYENFALPFNVTYGSKEWNDIIFFYYWVVTYLYTGQLKTLQLTSFNLFNKMFAQLNGKMNGTFNKTFAIHSAHDTTLLPMLATLGITTVDCLRDVYLGKVNNSLCEYPGYSANIITELYNDTDKPPYVKIRYNGIYVNVCNTSNNTCTLSAYQKLVNDRLKGYTFSNWLEDCGISAQSNDSGGEKSTLIALVIALGVVCVVEVVVLVHMITRKRKKVTNNSSEQLGTSMLITSP